MSAGNAPGCSSILWSVEDRGNIAVSSNLIILSKEVITSQYKNAPKTAKTASNGAILENVTYMMAPRLK